MVINKTKMTSIDPNVQKRGAILFWNGFGFQSPGVGVGDVFALAYTKDLSNEQVNNIRSLSGASTFAHNDWIGHPYITIHWTEYNKHVAVFNAMLELGISFKTTGNLKTYFHATKDNQYSRQIEEIKAIQQFDKNKKLFDISLIDYIDLIPGNGRNWLKEWNWVTTEGKNFCKQLRRELRKKPYNLNSKDNYLNWDIFKNYNPNTLQSIVPEVVDSSPSESEIQDSPSPLVSQDEDEMSDDNICMICMDNVANTMVLPCEHCVVCTECSVRLRDTADKETCVRCRRRIAHILE